MKNFKRTIAFVSALTLMGTMAACANDSGSASNETTTTTAPKELNEEDKAAVDQMLDVSEDEKLENGTVKWLSWYDINPADNKPKLTALELFETKYGGKIEFIPTTWENRFNDLSTLVVG
ncbi:MAG: carbohydrate ABC transporter substrate-binding protein, partial [Oscillospiraceae bacterium]|nr:carbohydrate ABC transporter substrate-binding protein [Oscillospiraceae bacterium]